jgi:hypothetical protein
MMLLDVTQVSVISDFTLLLDFENGERRQFDMNRLLQQKPWSRLLEKNTFQAVFIEHGTVNWPGNIDIDPETLYEYSQPIIAA